MAIAGGINGYAILFQEPVLYTVNNAVFIIRDKGHLDQFRLNTDLTKR